MIISKIVEQNFSRHPEDYNNIADTQREIASKVADLIEDNCCSLETPDVLELGCGTGFLTKQMMHRMPDSLFLITDISPAMLQFCRADIPLHISAKFAICDITQGCPGGMFDIITSSLAFQWVDNLDNLMRDLYDHLKADGYLIFTTLTEGTFANIATIFEKKGTLFPLPELVTVEDLKKATSCFEDITVIEETYVEKYNSIKDFLDHIHKVGAGNATGSHISVSKLRQIIKEGKNCREIIAEYKVAFVICRKGRGRA